MFEHISKKNACMYPLKVTNNNIHRSIIYKSKLDTSNINKRINNILEYIDTMNYSIAMEYLEEYCYC